MILQALIELCRRKSPRVKFPYDASTVRAKIPYLCGFEGFQKPLGTPFSAPFSKVEVKKYKLN